MLEVACGTGRNFEYLERAIGPMGSLVGVDVMVTCSTRHAGSWLVGAGATSS